MKIRNTSLEFRKIDDKEVQIRKRDINTNYYDYPDGVTHWHAYGIVLIIFMILFYFIPLFTIEAFGDFLAVSRVRHIIFIMLSVVVSYYLVYIKKSNKEWLKKKINKKAKEFYL